MTPMSEIVRGTRWPIAATDGTASRRGWPTTGHTLRRRIADITFLRAVELIAAAFGLAGMALGSTAPVGIACYAVAIPCLIYCVYCKELWGLLTLNLAQVVIVAFNAWRAF